MNKFELRVVDFSKNPYGRYPDDSEFCGQNYREDILEPALREHDAVHVYLDGYNRYGRSFLDEAFGGLIRESSFSGEEIKKRLTYSHELVPNIVRIIEDRIEAAINDAKQ